MIIFDLKKFGINGCLSWINGNIDLKEFLMSNVQLSMFKYFKNSQVAIFSLEHWALITERRPIEHCKLIFLVQTQYQVIQLFDYQIIAIIHKNKKCPFPNTFIMKSNDVY
jgi:hypothetical protein